MLESIVAGSAVSSGEPLGEQYIEPSFANALPHYLPLVVFPLLVLASLYGGWWLIGPFVFMSLASILDKVVGFDGLNMSPKGVSDRQFIWYNIAAWGWAFLWPPTLAFGMYQILMANAHSWWESVILVMLLTMEAQAVFVVAHEMIHRRRGWERGMGEWLLSANSYPTYATEHVYIHHAKVGTPHDVGSAPKGQSFWRYLPREIWSNITGSWKIACERLARSKKPKWHYSNPFWRFALFLAFWWGLAYYMGGIWAVLVYIALGLSCVFSMKITNYFQHYGLRRVLLPNGRWERIAPRHSWSTDWKFSNWMFYKMQRHADHHAMATRPYPQLQFCEDDSPQLPGTYGDLMNLVLRPKKWFEKMDPLVDEWRKKFWPEVDDWTPYDSQLAASRPDDFHQIVEIFGLAPRLANWIELHPDLLDTLSHREFTDLDLPKGIMDDEEYDLARRGLARVYWTFEMGVQEMLEQIEDIPANNSKETAEFVRNWSNDKAFQIGMHVVRDNLTPAEASIALSNLAEASISSVVASTITDFVERVGETEECGLTLLFLGDLATRNVYAGVDVRLAIVHEGWNENDSKRLVRNLQNRVVRLTHGSLLFSELNTDSTDVTAFQPSDFFDHFKNNLQNGVIATTRIRRVYEYGQAGTGQKVEEARQNLAKALADNDSLQSILPETQSTEPNRSPSLARDVEQKINEIEGTARYLQLRMNGSGEVDASESAVAILHRSGAGQLAEMATFLRDLQGIGHLALDDNDVLEEAPTKVRSLLSRACGHVDIDSMNGALKDLESLLPAELESAVQAK